MEAYKPHETEEMLIHFRIKTHGALSTEMCHPFEINDHLAMIHNGIITGHGTEDNSDTYEFVQDIIKPITEKYGDEIIKDKSFQKLLDKYIGWSKLMFLNAETQEHIIINESSCNITDGITFSNYSWQKNEKKLPQVFNTNHLRDSDTNFPNYHIIKKQQTHKNKRKLDNNTRAYKVRECSNYYNETFEEDCFAKLKWQSSLAGEKGDIVLIKNIWNNNTIDLYNITADTEVSNVHVSLLTHANEKDLESIDY